MTRAKDISKIVTDADLSGTLDVTGTVTAGGLTMDTGGNSTHILEFGADRTSDSQALGIIRGSWNGTVVSQINLSAGDDTTNKDNGQIFFRTAEAGTTANRLRIEENGDISFYEDTGTTAKLFWDASTERLGVGTSSPSTSLHVSTADENVATFTSTDTAARIVITDGTDTGYVNVSTGKVSLGQTLGLSGNNLNIDSSGNVGIGTTSPAYPLDVNGGTENVVARISSTDADALLVFEDNSTTDRVLLGAQGEDFLLRTDLGKFVFKANNNTIDAVTILNNGNVGIGTTSPATDLDVTGNILTSTALYLNSLSVGSMAYFSYAGGNPKLWNTANGALLFGTNNTERMRISAGGDISFYEDTGTTAKFKWDSSEESITFNNIVKKKVFEGAIAANGTYALDISPVSTSFLKVEVYYRCFRQSTDAYSFIQGVYFEPHNNTTNHQAFIETASHQKTVTNHGTISVSATSTQLEIRKTAGSGSQNGFITVILEGDKDFDLS